ncbi:MAG: cupredoxin domain-containing protein [Candidatus Eisenbacteria bacterium]
MKRIHGFYALVAVFALTLAGCGGTKTAAQHESPAPVAASGAQEVSLTVTDAGFEPAQITVAKDRPITLSITRKTDQTCAREIVFKDLDLKRDLPLNEEVRIDLPARPSGTLNYACGMDMIKGSLVVQ